ncbi:MAG TPA: hypothetical protein VFN67_42855 [Polyangiales bacterium]|nr:hypothetical protein [Polyangiales bacterium]
MDLFDVYVLRFDVSEDRAARSLMHVFGLSEASARVFVHSVPRIGKRDVPTQLAERYVRALHAVGAVVECRRVGTAPLGESANRAQHMSLPAPSDAAVAAATNPPHISQDSLGIMAPLQYTPDMPQIPKAPRVPADLHHLRARKGPDSMAPNWHPTRRHIGSNGSSGRLRSPNSEPSSWNENSDMLAHSRDPLSELKDAPDELVDRGVRGQRRGAARSPQQKAREDDDDDSEHESEPPRSPSPFAPSQSDQSASPWYLNATHQLLLAALILGGMGLALTTGVFQSSNTQITHGLHEAGLEPGKFETATSFASQAKNQFGKLSTDQLRGLTELLMSTGAREIWVADIQQVAQGRTSRTLVIELPDDPSARRAVFDELASARSGVRNVSDTGQRYVRVDF